MKLRGSAAVLAVSVIQAAAQNASVTDTFKQVLEKRLMILKPDYAKERNVLFQDVKLLKSNAGSHQFEVTLLIRDYDPGYPPNRYYGRTCVSKMNQRPMTFGPDGKGGWDVDGAMTVTSGPDLTCKNNPGAGVSSIPVETLSGTAAPAGAVAAPAGGGMTRTGQGVATGSYECWANGQARMMLNFSIRDGKGYTDSSNEKGTYSFDAGTGRINFTGGLLDGFMPKGFYSVYHEPQGRPTVSFRNPGGSEASFCQRVR